jgi:hypothetical protein
MQRDASTPAVIVVYQKMLFNLLFLVAIGRVSGREETSYEQYLANRLVREQQDIDRLILVKPHPHFDPIKAAGFKHFTDISKSSNADLLSRNSNDIFSYERCVGPRNQIPNQQNRLVFSIYDTRSQPSSVALQVPEF